MNDFNVDNEIIEISSDDTSNGSNTSNGKGPVIEEKPKVVKKKKKSLKDKWDDLEKKTKITIIVISILLVLVIIGLVLYFVVFNNKEEINEPKEEPIVVEKDNYRYENGKLIFLDSNEKEIGSYECVNKDSEQCFVAKLDFTSDEFERVISVNEKGEELEKNSKIYLNKYVFVYDEDKISLYNIESKEKEINFKSIKSYDTSDNLVVVEDEDSKYGLLEINEDGYEYRVRCSYDNLGIVNSELVYLLAQDKDDYYVIDKTGKKLSKDIFANVESVNDKYIVGSINNSYSLYDYEYNELISDYDYISLHDEVIALVKSNRIYLVDSNLNKLYEEGIRLENADYVKKYVYNDNNKLVDTKKSYEIDVNNNIANITIGKSTTEINILEGRISSKYNYLSYYDGKLYFYGDEDKEDIIGTYTCTNKNNLDSEEDALSNCFVYKNDLGLSGIYNNEYVFVYDNASLGEVKYYLYNIKEKKNKGTYSSIEIVKDSEINENIKQLYTSSSFIIAKSGAGDNTGNYGVLEITSDKVSGKVGFKYESIKKEKNYYLLINVDKSYSIYDNNFTKVSNEFDYIEIFDNYYGGIKDNKLNVYSYNNALGILDSDLEVKNNEFTIDFTNGFDITIDGVTYNYDKEGKVIEGVIDEE